jgi:uncharacterized protein (DUF1800 family)
MDRSTTTAAKTFSFPIYPDGGRTIPARSQNDGMQDGIDLINGLVASPNTGRYLARKLFRFFVSEFREPDQSFITRIAGVFGNSKYDMRIVMREVFLTPEFWDPSSYWARYSWPVEFVGRMYKNVGWSGASANDALTPLANMGQALFDPPDVAGWDLGPSWFSSGAMLARMNFASSLAGNQRFNIASAATEFNKTPQTFFSYITSQIATPPVDSVVRTEWMNYLTATGAWTGAQTQLQAKAAGLVHLIAGSPEYQLQ